MQSTTMILVWNINSQFETGFTPGKYLINILDEYLVTAVMEMRGIGTIWKIS